MPPSPHSPESLRLSALAEQVGVCRNTLKKWLASGMPHYQIGRVILVRRDDFWEWLNQYRRGAAPEDLSPEAVKAVWERTLKEV